MTFINKITLVLTLTAFNCLPALSNSQLPQLNDYEAERLEAIQSINSIGAFVNNQKTTEAEKSEAEFAYNGFIARYQKINQEHSQLIVLQLNNDPEALKNYSKRLDCLMNDLHAYLK